MLASSVDILVKAPNIFLLFISLVMCAILFLVASAFLAIFADGTEAMVTPIQEVIEWPNGMLEKVKAVKQSERVQFAAFKHFCDDTTVENMRAIAEANEMIHVLKSDIQQYAADAARILPLGQATAK